MADRRLASGASEASARLMMRLRGPPGHRPDQFLQAIGNALSTAMGQSFASVSSDEVLQSYALGLMG